MVDYRSTAVYGDDQKGLRQMLVVDDEPDLCECLSDFFSTRGFAVVSVHSGEQALEWLENSPTDVILLDINLPGLHGLEILRRIRQIAPSSRVIMVSALGFPELRENAKALGAIAYVTKPFDFSDRTWAPVFAAA